MAQKATSWSVRAADLEVLQKRSYSLDCHESCARQSVHSRAPLSKMQARYAPLQLAANRFLQGALQPAAKCSHLLMTRWLWCVRHKRNSAIKQATQIDLARYYHAKELAAMPRLYTDTAARRFLAEMQLSKH